MGEEAVDEEDKDEDEEDEEDEGEDKADDAEDKDEGRGQDIWPIGWDDCICVEDDAEDQEDDQVNLRIGPLR